MKFPAELTCRCQYLGHTETDAHVREGSVADPPTSSPIATRETSARTNRTMCPAMNMKNRGPFNIDRLIKRPPRETRKQTDTDLDKHEYKQTHSKKQYSHQVFLA